MNNTFGIKRFGLVIGKDFQENWKRYGLQFLAMFGIIAVVLFFQSESMYKAIGRGRQIHDNNSLLALACILFFGFGVVFASTLMEPMRSKTKRTSFLMNPASNLEKYVSRWLIVTVGYTIAFFAALWLADLLRVAIFSIRYPEIDINMLNIGKLTGTGNLFPNNYFFCMCVGLFFFFQSICVLGSTFWEKASFVKTFAASTVIVLLFFLLSKWTISVFYTNFNQFENVLESIFWKNEMSDDKIFMVMTGVFVFFTLINWTIAFFRFRESEIIKRW